MSNLGFYDKLSKLVSLRLWIGWPLGGIKKLHITKEEGCLKVQHNIFLTDEEREKYPQRHEGEDKFEEFRKSLSELPESTFCDSFVDKCAAPEQAWSLTLIFSDGEQLNSSGVGNHPADWDKLMEILSRYAPILKDDEDEED